MGLIGQIKAIPRRQDRGVRSGAMGGKSSTVKRPRTRTVPRFSNGSGNLKRNSGDGIGRSASGRARMAA